jgi:hypothetical protein
MKALRTILLFLGTMFVSLLASIFITWILWQLQITEKAFHCTDDNLSGFWVSMDTHQGAGDTVMAGWTWEELKVVRMIYEVTFFTFWIGGGMLAFWILQRLFKSGPPNKAHALDGGIPSLLHIGRGCPAASDERR